MPDPVKPCVGVLTAATYTTPDGKPTCALNFKEEKVCAFLRIQKFGMYLGCLLGNDGPNGKMEAPIRQDGNGFLIPLSNCPLWQPESTLYEGPNTQE